MHTGCCYSTGRNLNLVKYRQQDVQHWYQCNGPTEPVAQLEYVRRPDRIFTQYLCNCYKHCVTGCFVCVVHYVITRS